MYNFNGVNLLTNADEQDIFSAMSDKERIKYMSHSEYSKMPLLDSFEIYYNVKLSQHTKEDKNINEIKTINVGDICNGYVTEFNNRRMMINIPGIKDEIICKEDFTNCYDNVRNWLMVNNNTIYFEVREHIQGKYYVSVINAFYKIWMSHINSCIKNEKPITVHIDELVKGGYMCHTNIDELCKLTGTEYTHSVFIPGSHIVLNIESDFEKWLGEDVEIIPQKFVEFKKTVVNGQLMTENSLVGSRKRLLQISGDKNIYNLYNTWKLASSDKFKGDYKQSFEGTVTGIINSKKKVGVFVELDDLNITGLMPIESYELLNYKPGDKVGVTIKTFEVQEGKEPFQMKKGKIQKANVRIVLQEA